MLIFEFDELEKADLIPGAIYLKGTTNDFSSDALVNIFKNMVFKVDGAAVLNKSGEQKGGVGNQGGIRPSNVYRNGKATSKKAFLVILHTVGDSKENEYTNFYDEESRVLSYDGDKVKRNINYITDIYKSAYSDLRIEREKACPIFYFQNVKYKNRSGVRFIGTGLPFVEGKKMSEVRTAIITEGKENINIKLTIDSKNIFKKEWISQIKNGLKENKGFLPTWINLLRKVQNQTFLKRIRIPRILINGRKNLQKLTDLMKS